MLSVLIAIENVHTLGSDHGVVRVFSSMAEQAAFNRSIGVQIPEDPLGSTPTGDTMDHKRRWRRTRLLIGRARFKSSVIHERKYSGACRRSGQTLNLSCEGSNPSARTQLNIGV